MLTCKPGYGIFLLSDSKECEMVNTTQAGVHTHCLNLNISSSISYRVYNTRLLVVRSLESDSPESNRHRQPSFVFKFHDGGWVSYGKSST